MTKGLAKIEIREPVMHSRPVSMARRVCTKPLHYSGIAIVACKIRWHSALEVVIATSVKRIWDTFGLHFGQYSR